MRISRKEDDGSWDHFLHPDPGGLVQPRRSLRRVPQAGHGGRTGHPTHSDHSDIRSVSSPHEVQAHLMGVLDILDHLDDLCNDRHCPVVREMRKKTANQKMQSIFA